MRAKKKGAISNELIDEQLLCPFVDEDRVWVPSKYPGTETVYEVCRETLEVREIKTKRVIVPYPEKDDYLRFRLYVNGKSKLVYHHILIAYTFVDNPDPEHKTQVDHINGKKSDNSPENLRWATPKENVNGFKSEPVKFRLLLGIDTETDTIKYICASVSDASLQTGKDYSDIKRIVNKPNRTVAGCTWLGYVLDELKQILKCGNLPNKYFEGIDLSLYT